MNCELSPCQTGDRKGDVLHNILQFIDANNGIINLPTYFLQYNEMLVILRPNLKFVSYSFYNPPMLLTLHRLLEPHHLMK